MSESVKYTVNEIILSSAPDEEKRQRLNQMLLEAPEKTILQIMQFYHSNPESDPGWLDLFYRLPALMPAPREIHTIALVSRRLYNGGIERVVANLLFILQDAGFKTVLFTDEPANPLDYPVPQNLTRIILPGNPAERIAFLKNALHKYKADLLFHHVYSDPELLGDLLTAKTAGIPVVMTYHNAFTVFLCMWEQTFRSFLKILRLTEKVFALSNPDADFFRIFGVPSECLVNPMSFPCIQTIQRSCAKKNPIILFPARISMEKNPLDILRIFWKIHQQIPSAVLQIAGMGDSEELNREIEKEIRKQNLSDSVHLLGFCKEMQPLYENADLMLMTSDYEGFPLTLVEAKSMALPIVAYNLPYLLAMQPGTGVLTVPLHDTEAAAEKAIELLTHPEMYQKYSEEALNNARCFASVDLVQEYRRIFSALFEARNVPDQKRNQLLDTLCQGLSLQRRNAYKAGAEDAKKQLTSSLTYRAGKLLTALPVWLKNKISGEE